VTTPTSQLLIFTPERIAKAEARGRRYSGPVLDQLILHPDDWVGPQREQLERIAARIPDAKRRRVLGGLESDGAGGVVNQLLLAATLEENGWTVEHEPNLDGGTPDLRIERDGRSLLVEVVRVEHIEPMEAAMSRIRDALDGERTLRRIYVTSAHVDGAASLKPFFQHVLSLSSLPGSEELRGQVFQSEGVLVVFDLLPPEHEPVNVIFGWTPGPRFGDSVAEIRAAIAKKVKAYKLPLVVAVDLANIIRPFHDTRSAVYGSEAFRIPIDVNPASPTAGTALAEGSWVVLPDGPLNAFGSAGERARNRLVAVLPLQVYLNNARYYVVNAALLGNPLLPDTSVLAPFAPIPRCVPKTIKAGQATMTWLGAGDAPLEGNDWLRWSWVPAETA
jgi:hypothetical protein